MSLRFALLAAIHEQSATGYELTQRFRTRLANVWNASHQQIYRELGKLQEESMLASEEVAQAGKPDRKIYRITEKGVQTLSEWLRKPHERPPTRDPLLVKLFAGDLLDIEALKQELASCRQRWQEQLDYYRQVKAEYFSEPDQAPLHYRLQYMALRKGMLAMEMNLAWADEIDGVLGSH